MKGCANMNVQIKLFEAALCIEKPLYIRNINYFISMIYLEAGNLRFNTIISPTLPTQNSEVP